MYYLQNDTKFILHLCKIIYYFGFVLYKPDKYKISISRKLYYLILNMFFFAAFFSYYYYYYLTPNKDNKMNVIYLRMLHFITEINNFLLVMTLFVSTNYLSSTNWITFFQELNEIDEIFTIRLKCVNKRHLAFYYVDCFTGMVPLLVMFGYTYIFQKIIRTIRFYLLINSYFYYINVVMIVIIFLIINFLSYINTRFVYFIEYFETNIKNYSYSDVDENEIINEIRNGIKLFRKLSKHLKNFNNIYDWFIFLYIINITVGLFTFIYYKVLNNNFEKMAFLVPYLALSTVRSCSPEILVKQNANFASFRVF